MTGTSCLPPLLLRANMLTEMHSPRWRLGLHLSEQLTYGNAKHAECALLGCMICGCCWTDGLLECLAAYGLMAFQRTRRVELPHACALYTEDRTFPYFHCKLATTDLHLHLKHCFCFWTFHHLLL